MEDLLRDLAFAVRVQDVLFAGMVAGVILFVLYLIFD
jgi:hypothetical protein